MENSNNQPDKKKILIISSILVAGGVAAYLFFASGSESTDNAYLKSDIVNISPKVMGYITEINAEENQLVKAGDIILKIDEKDYKAKLTQSEANVASTEARLKSIEINNAILESNLKDMEARVKSAKAKLDRAEADFKRANNLITDKAISQQSYDKIKEDHINVSSSYDSQLEAKKIVENQMEANKVQKEEVEALVKNSRAILELAQIDLENTVIKAPFDAVIGHKTFNIGQLARPGAVFGYFIKQNLIWVEANFKETQIEKMKPGNKVKIEIDAYPSKKFTGKVESFAPASGAEFSILPPENASGNFTKVVRRIPVKIKFDNEEDLKLLKPGMSAIVKVYF